jgi:hypothetical protein
MLLPRLMQLIESHADQLADQVLHEIATSPRLHVLKSREEEVLRKRVHELYHDLGHWLSERDEARLEEVFGNFGRHRRADGTPLNEVVYALTMTKNHLWAFIERNDVTDQPMELAQERHLLLDIGRFFDRAVFHTVLGYEHAPPADQVAGATATAARKAR